MENKKVMYEYQLSLADGTISFLKSEGITITTDKGSNVLVNSAVIVRVIRNEDNAPEEVVDTVTVNEE